MLLENQVALVTGASRGIGAAIAKQLAAHGAAVAINYKSSEDKACGVLAEIENAGGRGMVVRADVTVSEEVEAMVRMVEERLGSCNILINNANIPFPIQPFMKMSWSDCERKLADEIKAIFLCAQRVAPGMIERKRGVIVNISSGLSRQGLPGFIAHVSAKAAMDAFSRTLAAELGPHGIRVNVIAPGFTATDATAHLPAAVGDGFAAQAPLRRVAQPEDVARAVLFYCTELAGFVTGTYLNVCGGQQMD